MNICTLGYCARCLRFYIKVETAYLCMVNISLYIAQIHVHCSYSVNIPQPGNP